MNVFIYLLIWFVFASFQTLYTISSRMEPLEESGTLLAGSTCKWHVTFTCLTEATDNSRLLYDVDSDTNTWAVNGRKRGVVTIPRVAMATTDVVLNVIPQTGGHLAMPAIKLMKYIEKDEKSPQPETKDEANGEVTASEAQSSRGCPLVLPFSCGQVYNKTLAVRVRVLPNSNSGHLLI